MICLPCDVGKDEDINIKTKKWGDRSTSAMRALEGDIFPVRIRTKQKISNDVDGDGNFKFGDNEGQVKFYNGSFSITGSDAQIQVTDINIRANGFQLSSNEASMSLGTNFQWKAYGGSVNPTNSKEILSQELVDGVLVGGASTKYKDLHKIINSI